MRYLLFFCLLLLSCQDRISVSPSEDSFFRIYQQFPGDFNVVSVREIDRDYLITTNLSHEDSIGARLMTVKVNLTGQNIERTRKDYKFYYDVGRGVVNKNSPNQTWIPCGRIEKEKKYGSVLFIYRNLTYHHKDFTKVHYMAHLEQTSDGWIMMGYDTSRTATHSLHLIKTDKDGNEIWDVPYPYHDGRNGLTEDEKEVVQSRVVVLKNGGYMLTTFERYGVPPNYSFNKVVLFVDSNGKELGRLFRPGLMDIDCDSAGNGWMLSKNLMGDIYIISFDPSSPAPETTINVQDTVNYFDVSRKITLRASETTRPVVLGTPVRDDIYFYVYDKNPNLSVKGRLVRGGIHDYTFGDIRQTRDGGYIIAGTVSILGSAPRKICLFKTDKDGKLR